MIQLVDSIKMDREPQTPQDQVSYTFQPAHLSLTGNNLLRAVATETLAGSSWDDLKEQA